MGTISNTEPDTKATAAAVSQGDASSDGSHPETTPDDNAEKVPQLNAPGTRMRALWAKPTTQLATAITAGLAIALLVLALTNVSFKHNKPLGSTTIGNPNLQSQTGSKTAPKGPAGESDIPTSDTPTTGQTTLDDTKNGYKLTYANTWSEVPGPGGDEHVIQIAGKNAFSIRTFPLKNRVATANLDDMRAVTDSILSTPGAKLQVIDVRKVEVAGLPAVYYLYYFPDGKQRGVHAHYFVFDGTRMHTFVFQVVPAADFPKYAKAFDQVVASFKPLDH